MLLRELLTSGQLQRQAHGRLAFAALDASMQDTALVSTWRSREDCSTRAALHTVL